MNKSQTPWITLTIFNFSFGMFYLIDESIKAGFFLVLCAGHKLLMCEIVHSYYQLFLIVSVLR